MPDQNNFLNPEKNKNLEIENNEIEKNSENKEYFFDSENSPKENEFVSESSLENPEKPDHKIEQEQKNEKEKQSIKTEKKDSLDNKIDFLKKKLLKQKNKKIEIPQIKDELTVRIEKVMEEGMEDAFQELSPLEQQEFKIKGEETAWKIRQLLKKTHIKIKEIFKLLFAWLRMLPGVNKFFLEQEAKIKADKIFSLRKK
ncbi:MAG: hypothetical protein WC414_01325 [Patescibacteria group bacterium]